MIGQFEFVIAPSSAHLCYGVIMHAATSQVCAYAISLTFYMKEIKNSSECIVELYKQAGIFKSTREERREARGAAECFSHLSSVLKNSQVLT